MKDFVYNFQEQVRNIVGSMGFDSFQELQQIVSTGRFSDQDSILTFINSHTGKLNGPNKIMAQQLLEDLISTTNLKNDSMKKNKFVKSI